MILNRKSFRNGSDCRYYFLSFIISNFDTSINITLFRDLYNELNYIEFKVYYFKDYRSNIFSDSYNFVLSFSDKRVGKRVFFNLVSSFIRYDYSIDI